MKKIILLLMILSLPLIIIFKKMIFSHSSSNQINKILQDFSERVNLGILVKDLTTGKILYQKNANIPFTPASNEKLLTAFAALHYLGKDFTYETQLFVDTHHIKQGILNDDVYFRFSGDPTLTVAQLDHLIQQLSKVGVREINGNIIVDDSAFDQMSMSPGTTWDDKDFCWGAPIHAIIIERNCVTATLTPAIHPNQPAILSLPDYPQNLQFINHALTSSLATQDCLVHVKRTSESAYTIGGCINAPKNVAVAINDPRINLQKILVYLLNKNQISGKEVIKFQKTQAFPPLLVSEHSAPLTTLIITMLKHSDNTIANSLFKTIGGRYAQESGSFQNGSFAVRNILHQSLQLDIPETTLIDGDGASRYDFLTPQQLVSLLEKTYYSPHATLMTAALPIGGVDGTLKNRLTAASVVGKVRAKTGTETAVSCLSGYLETQQKHTLAFSIMINGFVDALQQYENLEDEICKVFIENN